MLGLKPTRPFTGVLGVRIVSPMRQANRDIMIAQYIDDDAYIARRRICTPRFRVYATFWISLSELNNA